MYYVSINQVYQLLNWIQAAYDDSVWNVGAIRPCVCLAPIIDPYLTSRPFRKHLVDDPDAYNISIIA